ncbi:hypothetical protein CYMTET_37016, partial [Cymbomonas tetramitiformis]
TCVRIGRHPTNDIVLESESVALLLSRFHAYLERILWSSLSASERGSILERTDNSRQLMNHVRAVLGARFAGRSATGGAPPPPSTPATFQPPPDEEMVTGGFRRQRMSSDSGRRGVKSVPFKLGVGTKQTGRSTSEARRSVGVRGRGVEVERKHRKVTGNDAMYGDVPSGLEKAVEAGGGFTSTPMPPSPPVPCPSPPPSPSSPFLPDSPPPSVPFMTPQDHMEQYRVGEEDLVSPDAAIILFPSTPVYAATESMLATVPAGAQASERVVYLINMRNEINEFQVLAEADVPDTNADVNSSSGSWVAVSPGNGSLDIAGAAAEIRFSFDAAPHRVGSREMVFWLQSTIDPVPQFITVHMVVVSDRISNWSVARAATPPEGLVAGGTAAYTVEPYDQYGNPAVLDRYGNPVEQSPAAFLLDVFFISHEQVEHKTARQAVGPPHHLSSYKRMRGALLSALAPSPSMACLPLAQVARRREEGKCLKPSSLLGLGAWPMQLRT